VTKFLAAWGRYWWARLRGYEVLASPELQSVRYNRCQRCEHNSEDVCALCGCLIYGKIALNTEECPARKWRRMKVKKVTPNR
jgi:hypothetical protein